MKLPIYSHIKAKLESKGLDSITSGQIAWFVCSVVIFVAPILYLYLPDRDQFTVLLFTLIIFLFNALYIYNFFPFSLVIVFIWIYIQYSYRFSDIIYVLVGLFAILILICSILRQWRFLITFCFGISFILLSLKIFKMLGGFYK